MQIRYTVHSSEPTTFDVTVDVSGQSVTASVQGHVVELVNDQMTHTLKALNGPDAEELAANFPVGAAIIGTFTPA